MDLQENHINIKVVNINKDFYLIITDLTITIVQIDISLLDNLDVNSSINYKDVCNIVIDNSSKVLTNDIKLKAIISFIGKNTKLFTEDLMKSLNSLVDLNLTDFSKKELKIIKVLTEKLNKTEKRYQDRRRIERMIKEFKYYLINEHNKNIKELENAIAFFPVTGLDIYLNSLIPSNKINTITVPLTNRGVCHIKEKNLYKSKYTKNMTGEELIHLLYKCINLYKSVPLNYSKILNKIYKSTSTIKVKAIKSI